MPSSLGNFWYKKKTRRIYNFHVSFKMHISMQRTGNKSKFPKLEHIFN